jgi:hypothetical protein
MPGIRNCGGEGFSTCSVALCKSAVGLGGQWSAARERSRTDSIGFGIPGGEGLTGAPAQTFRRIVDGTATPEETVNSVFKVISQNSSNASRAIGAIERIVGSDSPTMAAIRQGVWQKLTQNAAGKDQPGSQQIVQAIHEFLNGNSRTIAQQLYSPKELALMQRYADPMRLLVIPKYARTNPDTAPALLAGLRKYGSAIAGSIGFAHGDMGAIGRVAGWAAEHGMNRAAGIAQAKKIHGTLHDIIPKPRALLGKRVIASDLVRKGGTLAVAKLAGIVPSGGDEANPNGQ